MLINHDAVMERRVQKVPKRRFPVPRAPVKLCAHAWNAVSTRMKWAASMQSDDGWAEQWHDDQTYEKASEEA